MLGKTHSAVGATTALLVVGGTVAHNPVSLVTGAIVAAAGGLLPDIDLHSKHSKSTAAGMIALLTILSFSKAFLLNDKFTINQVVGLIALVALVAVGLKSNHRGFTHSILAIIMFSVAVYLCVGNLWTWFSIGYASHLTIDLLNKKGESLLFPIKTKICLNLCASDGITNKILGSVATVLGAVILFGRVLPL